MPIADADNLGVRGRALFLTLTARFPGDVAAEALILETARITDRLDELNRVLTGDDEAWVRITVPNGDGDELVLTVDRALGEARQLAETQRKNLAQLGVAKTGAVPTSLPAPADEPDVGGEAVDADDLARHRATRRARLPGAEAQQLPAGG